MARLTIEVDEHIFESVARIASGKELTPEAAASYLLEKTLFGMPRRSIVPAESYVPQRIPVFVDPKQDRIKKPFRCCNCGNVVFNYYGSVKLITSGQYDADNNMVDGEEQSWFDKLGEPIEIVCAGRIIVQYEDGHTGKKRCGYTFYKIGA